MNITDDFYPTPPDLIRRILSAVDWQRVSAVLEPSAGKGDLADAVKLRIGDPYRRSNTTVDCIELDPNLQHILTGKGHTVVHDDFLTFRTVKRYDAIIANFPFSDGDKHMLHALWLLRHNGGQLVALVNAETIRNPYGIQRQWLVGQLEEFDADITYLQDQFADAERRTDVEVALVTVQVPADAQPALLLDSLQDAARADAVTPEQRELASDDPVESMIARFDLECRAGASLIAEYDALKPLMLDRMSLVKDDDAQTYAKPILELKIDTAYGERPVNAYVRATRHKYWHSLIGNPKFRSSYTSAILKALDGKLEELSHKDFTLFNIRQLDRDLRGEIPGSIEEAILALFDELSRKYAYVEGTGNNVHYYTGWKTNRAHKINTKVIIPVNGFSSYSFERNRLNSRYVGERLSDMVKVFQYLAGDKIDGGDIAGRAIDAANEAERFRNIDFHYFTATFYKKGTCHIRFTDQDLLDKFNIFGAQRRNWLPPSYGRRPYRDMDAEEQAVVDEFQGEAAYNDVMARRDYYLSAPTTPQLGMGEAA